MGTPAPVQKCNLFSNGVRLWAVGDAKTGSRFTGSRFTVVIEGYKYRILGSGLGKMKFNRTRCCLPIAYRFSAIVTYPVAFSTGM